jgi:hypothetical protein
VQTCSRCQAQSPDTAAVCQSCGADLSVYSTTAVALRNYRENPRVRQVRISVSRDACPACQQVQGTYDIDKVPHLPVEGCSHELGCRCFYDPVLTEIFP